MSGRGNGLIRRILMKRNGRGCLMMLELLEIWKKRI